MLQAQAQSQKDQQQLSMRNDIATCLRGYPLLSSLSTACGCVALRCVGFYPLITTRQFDKLATLLTSTVIYTSNGISHGSLTHQFPSLRSSVYVAEPAHVTPNLQDAKKNIYSQKPSIKSWDLDHRNIHFSKSL
ncbi:unnamed protein product [Ceratitis capitata]|uniref:(Mediterranean fruit fly) hypothetical protein n=1 Tax=Ceratitis capitata TaxID=7213 RepID=A0A811UAQ9_CERCA|nr:unnamed protein product [Ceratitis capitata]